MEKKIKLKLRKKPKRIPKIYIRGINVEINKINKEKKRRRFTNIKKIQKNINKRLSQVLTSVKVGKKKLNMTKRCYGRRFILKKRKLLKRRVSFSTIQESNEIEKEQELFRENLENFKWIDKKYLRRRKSFYSSDRYVPLHKREFKFGKIFVTHCTRNTFVTIYQSTGKNINYDKKVVYKASCGLVGYLGPKKETRFAREQVLKAAGNFLKENLFTSVDLIVTSKFAYYFIRQFRNLFPHPINVRYFQIDYRRTHGFTRKRHKPRK